MTAASDWDARTYDRVSNPHQEWAEQILGRLPLRGDETVMDAGCGSGRVTRLLLERLPEGAVFGVDASASMLVVAREQLAGYGDRVTLIQGELTTVQLPGPVDAIFSNATFHWIPDHAALFANLASLLRPGGVLVAQCGGAGNIAAIVRLIDTVLGQEPFASRRGGTPNAWNFAGAEATRARLQAAGFSEIETSLAPEPVSFPDAPAFATFVRTVVLGPYFAMLPADLHDAFVEAIVREDERDGATRTVDYVRLNMKGVSDLTPGPSPAREGSLHTRDV